MEDEIAFGANYLESEWFTVGRLLMSKQRERWIVGIAELSDESGCFVLRHRHGHKGRIRGGLATCAIQQESIDAPVSPLGSRQVVLNALANRRQVGG